jgi:integrase
VAKLTNKLTAPFVSAVVEPGTYPDGLGLYLQVTVGQTKAGPSVSKSWLFRYSRHGRAHWLGLGPTHTVTLAKARAKARKAREQLFDGVDPVAEKHAARRAALLEQASRMTFEACGAAYLAEHSQSWGNVRHRQQWKLSLDRANKQFGKLPVSAVDTDTVLKFLQPIWTETPETGSRIRGRIEAVLDWAKARKFRDGENPARWQGSLEYLLKAKPKSEHHSALPYAELPAFLAELKTRTGYAAAALQFLILTAARTGEARKARWNEIDMVKKLWTVPAERMKSGKEHQVPLSAAALALLNGLDCDGSGYVFPGLIAGKPLADSALLDVMKTVRSNSFTVHGFRSTFRDWAGDHTHYPRDVVEAALAHALKDKTEAAYRRGTALDKRANLMKAWGEFCTTPAVIEGGNVVSLHG